MSDSHGAERVGRVVGLWRYPVKSMAAEPLKDATVSWHGVPGDRRWAFVREGADQSGFPWLTLRDRPDMNAYLPRFKDPDRPDMSATLVRTPSGVDLDITDPALAAELRPSGARPIRHNRGVFDTFPLSLITTQTIAALGEMVGLTLSVGRFRPNFLIESSVDEPFIEDTWVGRILRLGDMRMRVDKRDGRCVVITIDPETGERSPEILKAVASERDGCLGVYGSTVDPGRLAVGDAVTIEPT